MNVSLLAHVQATPPASTRTVVAEKAATDVPTVATSAPERAAFPHSPDLSELADQLDPPERARQLALVLEGSGMPIEFKLATLRMMLEGPGLAPPPPPSKADASEPSVERADNPSAVRAPGHAPVDAEIFARVEKTTRSSRDPATQETRSGSVPPSASAQDLAKFSGPRAKGSLDLKG